MPKLLQMALFCGAVATLLSFASIGRAADGQTEALTNKDAVAFTTQAQALEKQEKYDEAVPLFRKALSVFQSNLGEDHRVTAAANNNLARNLNKQGAYVEAEVFYRKSLSIFLDVLGIEHARSATAYNNLALNLKAQGRYKEAETLHIEALDIWKNALDEEHRFTATGYDNLGSAINAQGRHSEAEPFYRDALRIRRIVLGEQHPETATSYNNVAINLEGQGRYGEAEPLYRRALEIRREVLGENHSLTASIYNNLAGNFNFRGRYADAEPLLLRCLDIRRTVFGEKNPRTAETYNNLAVNLGKQGRYKEAEQLHRKALEIRLVVLSKGHPNILQSFNNLAVNLGAQGQFEKAEPLLRKALKLRRATLGEQHILTARSYNNLAYNLDKQRQYGEAELLYRRGLEIRRTVLGEKHPNTALSYNNLAAYLVGQDKYAQAVPLFRKAVGIWNATLGEAHYETVRGYSNLALTLGLQGKYAEAETISMRAVKNARSAKYIAGGETDTPGRQLASETYGWERSAYSYYLGIATGLSVKKPDDKSRLTANAFRVAQDLIVSDSAQAMADAIVRNSSGSDALAVASREEQDLRALAGQLNRKMIAALGSSDVPQQAQLQREYKETLARLAVIEAAIDREYPAYRELISPKPLNLADTQKLLAPDEGLLVLVSSVGGVYSFAVTPKSVTWKKVTVPEAKILSQIDVLRCDADFDACSVKQQRALEKTTMTAAEIDGDRRFDVFTAHALYSELVAPVEKALEGVDRLYVTSSGPLSDLPLALLVTSPPTPDADIADPDVFLATEWLGDRYALTSLPAVSALRLRKLAKPNKSTSLDFRGYGDPALAPIAEISTNVPSRGINRGGSYYRSLDESGIRLGDPEQLMRIPSLPGTKTELEAMARLFGLGRDALNTGKAATESAIKQDQLLQRSNIISFATHGLLPSVGFGMEEPGLVFTPPKTATSLDDGILTASEVSQLTLSADWVILSACNTASTAKGAGGGDSLSALSRAFLYSGARALLASHWQVPDQATAALTVETLQARRDNPNRTRAQALQQAMRAVRTGKRVDGSVVAKWDPTWAHPTSWAAFSHIANNDE